MGRETLLPPTWPPGPHVGEPTSQNTCPSVNPLPPHAQECFQVCYHHDVQTSVTLQSPVKLFSPCIPPPSPPLLSHFLFKHFPQKHGRCEVSALPAQMPYLGHKCEEMTAVVKWCRAEIIINIFQTYITLPPTSTPPSRTPPPPSRLSFQSLTPVQ